MDSKLLQALYERYGRELYFYLRSLTGNEALSEDLLQETFLKALLALPDSHPNLRAWLYLVARNLYFNHRRQEGRLLPLPDEDGPAQPDGAEAAVLAGERRSALTRALGQLDSRKREVLLLQYYSHLSHREIAAILHLTPENVRKLSSRGRQELKRYMEENGYDL